MSCDLYKKMAIELIAGLADHKNPVICVTSSNKTVDTQGCAKKLAEAFCLTDLSVIFVNAKVNGSEEISKTQPKQINEKFVEISFEQKLGEKFTSFLAKAEIEALKTSADITVIALDELASSAPAMMIGSCCDGIILAERKNVSRTDSIDSALQTIRGICVKPLGFILA